MQSFNGQLKLFKPVMVLGFFLGLLLSWHVIGGDSQGRVNILQLVAIYVFLPIVTLLFSSLSLLAGKSWNFAKLTSLIPFWSQQQQARLLRISQHQFSQWYFFYQSQLAAMAFSLASLFVFIILLISTDVNFIWRSTLLNAELIYPMLDWLATPWQFWPSAQPKLELLKITQDSRILLQQGETKNFADWWRFILATQIVYAFLLRFIAIIVCQIVFKINKISPLDIQLSRSMKATILNVNKADSNEITLAKTIDHISSDYALNNWGGLDENRLNKIQSELEFSKTSEIKAGPLVKESEQMISERWQGKQLLIVKGWEPPLAELADFMQNGNGYLLPLDWDEDEVRKLSQGHLDEWRRFILPLTRWQLLQLDTLQLDKQPIASNSEQ